MESWRHTFRAGIVPFLSTPGLRALEQALITDDPRLLQGKTTEPPPLQCVQDWPVEAACFVGYAAWQGDGLKTVGEVEEAFAKCLFDADQRLGEPAGVRWFLNPFDDWPREQMLASLLPEVQRALSLREIPECPCCEDSQPNVEVTIRIA